MNIKIDLNITRPDGLVAALAALSGGVNVASAPAPKASKAKAEPAAAAPAETTATTEPAATLPPVVHVTDEQIIAAADAAVVKTGSNPTIIKNAVAARFQREDGTPATLKTVRADQRGQLHAFLVMVGQTGDVNGQF